MAQEKENINKLRIGIITFEQSIPAWTYLMLNEINKDQNNEFVLIVKNSPKNNNNLKSRFVYDFYKKYDEKNFNTKNNASELKNLEILFELDYVDIENVLEIRKYKVDVFINLNFTQRLEPILDASRYGVLSFHVGDFTTNNGEIQFFYDITKGKSLIKISLILHSKNKSYFLTNSKSPIDKISVFRGKNICLWRAASMIPRVLKNLQKPVKNQFFSNLTTLEDTEIFNLSKLNLKPNNFKSFFMLLKFNWKRISNIIRSFFYFDQWILLFNIENSIIKNNTFSKFKKIIPPKDRFWADPHVIKKNGKYYIFIEELIYKQNKGFISVIEMDLDGNYTDPVVILEKDYHLSFPFIIEDKEEIYMIPESSQNKTIELYKCIDFPYKWEFVKNLFNNIKAVDTVVKYIDNKYWLFTNLVEYNGASSYDELFLFSSDSLTSDAWNSHPQNPIVSDVQNARMAGRIFLENDKIYRPSQNCSNHYGYGMHINEIVRLDESFYKEIKVKAIKPIWDKKISSTHSISNTNNLIVIDAEYKRKK